MKFLDNIKNTINDIIKINFDNPSKQSENQSDKSQYTEHDYVNYYVRDLLDSVWQGDKFVKSFGATKNYNYIDYYTLRARSVMLFRENQYARGLIRRLITNLVYKGLNLESNPISQIIGMTDEKAIEWAEEVELKWELWSRDSYICDYNQNQNLAELESEIMRTAFISGDCLVILRINKITGLPCIEVLDGCHIQTPIGYQPRKGNKIKYGIEYKGKKQVAYHIYVQKENGIGYEYKRIPAYGEKSGRRIAWLVYGSDKLLDDCRGEPILANMLYMLKELDRYRDAATRAAVVNSLYPFLIKKVEKGISGIPMGAVRRSDDVTINDETGVTTQTLKFGIDNPGTIPSLPYGVDIASLNVQKSDINLGKFEEIITNVFAWTLEVPPEILKLLFQSNFSASRQANNELQLLIDKSAWKMGADFLQYIYEEWLISNVLKNNIKADGLIDAWLNNDWLIYNAWLNCEFTGLSRPSVDGLKDAQEEELKLKLGVTTFDQASKRLSKMKFRTIIQKRKIEQELMKRFGITSSIDEDTMGNPIEQNNQINNKLDEICNRLEYLEEN